MDDEPKEKKNEEVIEDIRKIITNQLLGWSWYCQFVEKNPAESNKIRFLENQAMHIGYNL